MDDKTFVVSSVTSDPRQKQRDLPEDIRTDLGILAAEWKCDAIDARDMCRHDVANVLESCSSQLLELLK